MVNYKTRFGRTIKGQCSSFLYNLHPQQVLYARFTKCLHEYKTLEDSERLIIATGTGIAPYLHFLQRTCGLKFLPAIKDIEHIKIPKLNNEIKIIWGCRNREIDSFAEPLLKLFCSSPSISSTLVFSRDSKEKRYVQHIIEENADVYGKLVCSSKPLEIYVCGSSKFLPQSLEKALKKCIKEFKNISETETIQIFQQLIIKYESFG